MIGGGQAGLAIGYLPEPAGSPLRDPRAGERARVGMARALGLADALHAPSLQRAARASVPGDPDGYPTRDEVIAYLERYAETFELPIELNSEVEQLDQRRRRPVRLERRRTDDHRRPGRGRDRARSRPRTCRSSAEKLGRRCLADAQPSATASRATCRRARCSWSAAATPASRSRRSSRPRTRSCLSVGSRQKPLPQRVLGRDLFWWLTKTRTPRQDGRVAPRPQAEHARHADRLEPARAHEALRRRAQAARRRRRGRAVRFEDGGELEVDAVIWATGYRPDYSWIELPIFDEDGRLRHRRGVTDVPGLYFLGLTWQHTRGSALIGWVKDDAEYIAERIASTSNRSAPAAATAADAGAPARRRPRGCDRCTSRATTRHARRSSSRRDTEGLPEARTTELVELADGDEFELEIRPVDEADRRRDRADARLQRLGPGPDAAGPAGRGDHRPRRRTTATSRRPCTGTGCGSRTATTARTRRRRRSRSARASPTGCTCPTPASTGTTRTSARTTARRWACTATSSSIPRDAGLLAAGQPRARCSPSTTS